MNSSLSEKVSKQSNKCNPTCSRIQCYVVKKPIHLTNKYSVTKEKKTITLQNNTNVQNNRYACKNSLFIALFLAFQVYCTVTYD